MKKLASLILLVVLAQGSSNAQAVNWFNPNSGFDYGVRTMCVSTTFNKLFVGGNFQHCNGFYSRGLAAYDTTGWTVYGETGSDPYVSIVEFQGNMYASGMKKLNGNSWVDFLPGNSINFMEVYNNELYFSCLNDTIGGVPVKYVGKWDGTTWYNLNFWYSLISSVIHYNGDLYVAGTFYDSTGTNVMNIARYDGTQWHDVGGGFHGGNGFVGCMAVYNGELYAGGYFLQAEGNVGNKIQKWNGISWSDVGGGLGTWGQVDALKVFNGELYAGGSFSMAGGIPVTYIAKWNGQQWCSLGSQIDNAVGALEVFNGELYIGGGFWTIDGDSIEYIAKWIGGSYVDTCSIPQGINDAVAKENGIAIYPNPVKDNLTIEISAFASEKKYLSIYNVLGEKVIKENFYSKKHSVNVSDLAKGIYITEVRNEKNILRRKFVKE